MTNEEIEKQAEEYADEILEFKPKNILCKRAILEMAFRAGANWGVVNATEWHEIKCCSQDLPPRSKDNYLHSVIVANEYGEPIYYDYNVDEWCDMEDDVVSEGYKYWCELPQFKE